MPECFDVVTHSQYSVHSILSAICACVLQTAGGANNLAPFLGPAMVRRMLLCCCVDGKKALSYRSFHNGVQHYATICSSSLLYSFSASTSRYRIPSNHSSCLFTAGVPTRRKQFAAN